MEDTRFNVRKNSELDCHDCIFNNSAIDTNVTSCDIFDFKPCKVLEGGKCENKIPEDR